MSLPSVLTRLRSTSEPTATPHRWLLPYADMLTVLFVVLLALQQAGSSTVTVPAVSPRMAQQSSARSAQKQTTSARLSDPSKERLGRLKLAWLKQGSDVQIPLKAALLFPPDGSKLSKTAQDLLHQLGPVLREAHGRIRVEGHTDNTPTPADTSNRVLSAERAARVADFLTDDLGLDSRQVIATGYGATRPVAPNSTSEGKQRNRRVVIVIEP